MGYDTEPTFAARSIAPAPSLSLAEIQANHAADAYHGSGVAADIAVLVDALARAEREIETLQQRLQGIEDRTVAHVRDTLWREPQP